MAGKKRSKPEDEEVDLRPISVVAGANINLHDLFSRLKEFENKVLLEHLKVLESSLALIYKEQLSQRAELKEIKQVISLLSLTQEELLNNMGIGDESYSVESEEGEESVEEAGDIKKWN